MWTTTSRVLAPSAASLLSDPELVQTVAEVAGMDAKLAETASGTCPMSASSNVEGVGFAAVEAHRR
jgi:hypothetical protein